MHGISVISCYNVKLTTVPWFAAQLTVSARPGDMILCLVRIKVERSRDLT